MSIEEVGRGSLLVEVPMLNCKSGSMSLHIKIGSKPYIFNNGTGDASLKAGLILAGYGKAKCRFAGGENPEGDPEKEVQYKLSGPEDLVLGHNCVCMHACMYVS